MTKDDPDPIDYLLELPGHLIAVAKGLWILVAIAVGIALGGLLVAAIAYNIYRLLEAVFRFATD